MAAAGIEEDGREEGDMMRKNHIRAGRHARHRSYVSSLDSVSAWCSGAKNKPADLPGIRAPSVG
jgi:hypothetical protein